VQDGQQHIHITSYYFGSHEPRETKANSDRNDYSTALWHMSVVEYPEHYLEVRDFWLCDAVELVLRWVYKRFGRLLCLHLQGEVNGVSILTLKMKRS
jgi:hypothetical protein